MHAPLGVIGEALIDIVVDARGATTEFVGGSPANVAVGLARLGHPCWLASHWGMDARGERIAALLAAEDVRTTQGSASAARTSTATAHLDAEGVASYDFDITWELAADAVPDQAGVHVHTGSIAATLEPGAHIIAEYLERARADRTISYDPNARPTLMGHPDVVRPQIEALIALSDVVKASVEDVDWLYPGLSRQQVLIRWAGLGPSLCLLTAGADGVVGLVNGQEFGQSAPTVQVADTIGAGDSFTSGLLSGLADADLLGGPAERERLRAADVAQIMPAITRALACAAITVSRDGANPPRREELRPH